MPLKSTSKFPSCSFLQFPNKILFKISKQSLKIATCYKITNYFPNRNPFRILRPYKSQTFFLNRNHFSKNHYLFQDRDHVPKLQPIRKIVICLKSQPFSESQPFSKVRLCFKIQPFSKW